MKIIFLLIFTFSFEVQAQKLFGLFGNDEKKTNSEKLSSEIELLLDNAKKNKNENALIDLDRVMELLRKQTQSKLTECREQKDERSKKNCLDDLVEFQENSINRLYDIRKEFLTRHHARVLEELEQTRIRHRETVKQASQLP